MVDETSSTEYQMPQIDVDKLMSIYAIREYLLDQNEELSEQVEEYVKGFVLENYENYEKEIVTSTKWWGLKETKEMGIVLSDGYREYRTDSFYIEIRKETCKHFNPYLSEDLKELCDILYSYDNPSNPDHTRKRVWIYENLDHLYDQIKGLEAILTPPEGSSCTTKQLKISPDKIDAGMVELVKGIDRFNVFVDSFYDVADRLGVFSGQDYVLNAQDLEDSEKLKLYLTECNFQLKAIQEHKEADDLIDYVATLKESLNESMGIIDGISENLPVKSPLNKGRLKSIINSLTVKQLEKDKIGKLVKEALPDLMIIE